jgi:hypothetical protein
LKTLIFLSFILCIGSAHAADSVLYFNKDDVTRARMDAKPLFESKKFRILMSSHDSPGQSEIHLKDTDIIYCFEGEAEFVTGGKAVGAKKTAPNELRGTSIVGGETRKIKGGDVLVIPRGVPHWFKSVQSTFLYSVVKIPE